eukprot:265611-Alexandrium_andersonii.AAC.1
MRGHLANVLAQLCPAQQALVRRAVLCTRADARKHNAASADTMPANARVLARWPNRPASASTILVLAP